MSNVTLYIFLAAVMMVVVAVAFNLPFVAGTAGLLMLVGIIYAYVVAKREFEASYTISEKR